MIKALLFDFFDVIHTDTLKAWLEAEGLKREGGFDDTANLFDLGKIDYNGYLHGMAKHSGQDVAVLHKRFEDYAKVDKDIIKLLTQFQNTPYELCLVTNSNSEEVRPLLKQHNIEPLFKHILVSSEVGMKKPDPAFFRHALELMMIQPQEAVFIDDNMENVKAAEQIGIIGIHHTTTEKLRENLKKLGIDPTIKHT